MQKKILIFLLNLIFILFSVQLYSQSVKSYPYYIEWEQVDGAGGYVVTVQNNKGKKVFTKQLNSKMYTIELQLPAGFYEFQIATLNKFMKVENSTEWIPIEILSYSPPQLLSFTPITLTREDPFSLSLQLDRISLDVSAILISPSGTKSQLTIKRIKSKTYRVSGPSQMEPGEYTLVLTNPPNFSTEIKAALTVRAPEPEPLPEIAEELIEPEPEIPAEPEPEPEPEPEQIIAEKSPESETVETVETAEVREIPEVTETPVPEKKQKPSLLPGKFAIGLGVNYDIPFSLWTKIYSDGFYSGFLCAEYFLTKNKRPIKGHSLDFSIGLHGEVSKWYNEGTPTYAKSTLQNFTFFLYPAFTFALPRIKFKYSFGAGLTFLDHKAATSHDENENYKTSVDAVVATALSLGVPITSLISIDLINQSMYVFNPKPLYKYSISLGTTFTFPARKKN